MSSETERELVHTRQITCRAFRLKNGWLKIEATLADEKGQEVAFRSRPPVQPGARMHSMSLLLTVDANLQIRDSTFSSLPQPTGARYL